MVWLVAGSPMRSIQARECCVHYKYIFYVLLCHRVNNLPNFPFIVSFVRLYRINQRNRYTFEVAPVFTLMENELIQTFCKMFGFQDGDGIFSPGGSMSNMYVLISSITFLWLSQFFLMKARRFLARKIYSARKLLESVNFPKVQL